MFKKILLVIFVLINLCSCKTQEVTYATRTNWNDDVRIAINDFVDLYGNSSNNYNQNAYVVSDFDNTASIFDMCEQFVIYQAEYMAYGFTPEQLPTILASGLSDLDKDLTSFGYGSGSYNDWILDITNAYTYLYNTYGPFNPDGVNDELYLTIQNDYYWSEFIGKYMNLYFLIGDNESLNVSYPWLTYILTGMSEQEVYALAKRSHHKYRYVDTSYKTITTSSTIDSKVGVVSYEYVEGVTVTDNIVELWKVLSNAGIDVWVCSASQCDIIRAAVDEFDLHDYCTGVIAMTPTLVDDKLSYTYDYENGYCWYCDDNDAWHKGDVASKAQTQGIGKVTAIENILVNEYGCDPLAGFMDSTGDFNFCTEFDDMKFVICFNRADRKVTDGGSLIAEIALYQDEVLDYDLKKANDSNDTYYVLQGRDENGKRSLRNSNATIKLNDDKERLFKNEDNYAIYDYMVNNKMSCEDIINTFSIINDDNEFGIKYGFLESYDGYHSK